MTENTEQPEIQLTFTLDEVNLILGALGELPAKLSMPVINNIHTQARDQHSPQPIPAED